MRRKLGAFEHAQAISDEYSPFNAVGIAKLTGGPGIDSLRQALDAIQRRHPLLGVHLVPKGRNHFYDSHDTPSIPVSLIDRRDDDHWMRVVENELNTRIDSATGPMVRCSYLIGSSEDGDRELVLTFHHSITDGTGAATVFRELLSSCQAIDAGRAVKESQPLMSLPEAERLFPPAFRGIRRYWHTARFLQHMAADEIVYQWQSRAKRQPIVHPSGKCRILTMHLSRETTERLISKTRRERLTVNSALCAAILLSANRHIYHEEDRLLRLFLFINLRPYLKPPVTVEHLGSYHSMLRLTAKASKNSKLLELARRINARTYEMTSRGDKYVSNLLSPAMMRTVIGTKRMRMATVALSYIGAVSFDPSYGSVKLRGIHSFASNFPVGPEYTANARLYQGRLWWDIVYLDCDMDFFMAKAIADEIRDILETAGESGGGM